MAEELMSTLRILELSGAGGVLVVGYVFLFRWLLPRVIQAVEDGMKSIAEEVKKTNIIARETNVALREIHKCLKETTTKITDVVREEVRHAQERQEDALKDVQSEVTTLRVKSSEQNTKVDRLLSQLGL
jgi:F0F1-type ATP synthase membrane subunit b/b'